MTDQAILGPVLICLSDGMRRKQLSWQPGFSLSRKPAKKPRSARGTNRAATTDANGTQQFEFVVEHPVREHGESRYSLSQSSVTTSTNSEATVKSTKLNGCQLQENPDPGWSHSGDFNLETFDGISCQVASVDLSSAAVPDSTTMTLSTSTSVPPSILYSSLSQRFRPILDRCMYITTYLLPPQPAEQFQTTRNSAESH
jgi:hypothetical protein